jgi:hypothetical protein
MKGKKEKVTIVEGGDMVNMRKAGTYTVTYKCKNAAGMSATPKTRTIIIDPKFEDDCKCIRYCSAILLLKFGI